MRRFAAHPRGQNVPPWLVYTLLVLLVGPPVSGELPTELDASAPETWILDQPDLYSVAARGDRVWAVGYWGSVLRSSDGGRSWTPGATPTREPLFAVDFADERAGWAVGGRGTILRSRDGGASWQLQGALVPDEEGELRPLDTHLFDLEAVSEREAWAVGDMGVVLHTEDGERWRAVELPPALYDDVEPLDRIFNGVDFADREHGWIVGEFGTVLRTRDGGASWSHERGEGISSELYLYAVAALDARRVAAVGLAGTVLASEDGGERWRVERAPTSAPLYGVHLLAGDRVVVGDRGEIFRSPGPGAPWSAAERPSLFNWVQRVGGDGGGRLFAVGEESLILGSTDGGRSWEKLLGSLPPPRAGISMPETSGSSGPGLERRRVPPPLEPGDG